MFTPAILPTRRILSTLLLLVASALFALAAPSTSSAAGPTPIITAGPNGHVATSTATFNFFIPPAGTGELPSAPHCKIDSGAYAACASPWVRAGLTDGSHTFYVRVRSCHFLDLVCVGDESLGWGSAAQRTWVVDTTPPNTTITSADLTTTRNKTPTFTFITSDTDTGHWFECSLDGALFAPCTSPKTLSTLSDGSHTFRVRAIDEVGNVDPTPALDTFVVDTVGPTTTILTGPPHLGVIKTDSATFTFSSSEPGSSACSIDSGAYGACTSPITASGLTNGVHTFSVRSTDTVGNVGLTAQRSFTVDVPAPEPPVVPPVQPPTTTPVSPPADSSAPPTTKTAGKPCAGKKGRALRRCKAAEKCRSRYVGKSKTKKRAKCLKRAARRK